MPEPLSPHQLREILEAEYGVRFLPRSDTPIMRLDMATVDFVFPGLSQKLNPLYHFLEADIFVDSFNNDHNARSGTQGQIVARYGEVAKHVLDANRLRTNRLSPVVQRLKDISLQLLPTQPQAANRIWTWYETLSSAMTGPPAYSLREDLNEKLAIVHQAEEACRETITILATLLPR